MQMDVSKQNFYVCNEQFPSVFSNSFFKRLVNLPLGGLIRCSGNFDLNKSTWDPERALKKGPGCGSKKDYLIVNK